MPENKKTPFYLNRLDVLDRYGIGSSTLYRWIGSGYFPKPMRFGSRCIRWKTQDLEAWDKKQD